MTLSLKKSRPFLNSFRAGDESPSLATARRRRSSSRSRKTVDGRAPPLPPTPSGGGAPGGGYDPAIGGYTPPDGGEMILMFTFSGGHHLCFHALANPYEISAATQRTPMCLKRAAMYLKVATVYLDGDSRDPVPARAECV